MASAYVMELLNKYLDNWVDDYCKALDEVDSDMDNEGEYEPWEYTRDAVRHLIENGVMAKSYIIDLLSKHPCWNERHLMVVLSNTHYTRDVDKYGCRIACDTFMGMIDKICDESLSLNDKHWINMAVSRLIYPLYLVDVPQETKDSLDYAEPIIQPEVANECNEWLAKANVKCRFSAGQKRSKAISKLARELELPDMPVDYYGADFNRFTSWGTEFAHYGDAINPLNVTKWTLISVNQTDFLMASNGDTWASCYNPNKSMYSGCNCSGGISCGQDKNTICVYTVDESYEGEFFELQPKHTRAWAGLADSQTAFHLLKVYPYSYESHFNEFKAILERVFADALDVPNLWRKTTSHEEVNNVLCKGMGSTVYPDWYYINNGAGTPIQKAVCWLSSAQSPMETGEKIPVGAKPICIECGQPHYYEDEISCCHPSSGWTCNNCDTRHREDDSECWSQFHREYGCENCMTFNDWCDDWFYDDDDTVWVENIGCNIPVCYMERYSGEFVQCDECGDWIYISNDSDYYRYEDDETGEVHFYCCEGCAPEGAVAC